MKVKVRIAVAVDPDVVWNACGWSSCKDEKQAMGIACDAVDDGEAQYFVEAELEVPRRKTVQGTVSQ